MTEVYKIAKEKGFDGIDSYFLIKEWLLLKHQIYAEVFFSTFHKTWSVNNYLIDTKKGKRIEWDYSNKKFEDYYDALELALKEMLKKI